MTSPLPPEEGPGMRERKSDSLAFPLNINQLFANRTAQLYRIEDVML